MRCLFNVGWAIHKCDTWCCGPLSYYYLSWMQSNAKKYHTTIMSYYEASILGQDSCWVPLHLNQPSDYTSIKLTAVNKGNYIYANKSFMPDIPRLFTSCEHQIKTTIVTLAATWLYYSWITYHGCYLDPKLIVIIIKNRQWYSVTCNRTHLISWSILPSLASQHCSTCWELCAISNPSVLTPPIFHQWLIMMISLVCIAYIMIVVDRLLLLNSFARC